MKRLLAILSVASLMLCGCGGATTDKSRDAAQAPTENRVLLDAAQRPLERAHEVEDITAGRKGELDEQIDSAAK